MKHSVFLITIFLLMSSVNFQINAQFDKLKKSVDKSVAGLSKTIKTAGDTKTTSTPATTSEKRESNEKSSAIGSGSNYYIRPDGRGKDATKEAPSKDIAAIAMQLKAGDVVHILSLIHISEPTRPY